MAADLPNEILLLTLDALNQFTDRLAVLQVCRNWHAALVSKVYSSVLLDPPEAVLPFAQSLLKGRHLASLVRELVIPNCFEDCFDEEPGGHYDPALFRDTLADFTGDAEELEEWESRLDCGERYAWLTVILILVPNLKHLNLRWDSFGGNFLVWEVSRMMNKPASLNRSYPLQHLEKLTITTGDVFDHTPARQLAPFLNLPAMRALHLSGVHNERDEEYTDLWTSLGLKPGSSSVREIILEHSNCRTGLAESIALCANLERFEYQHHNSAVHEESYWSYRCHPFHAALLTQKNSLRVLRLNDVGVTKNLTYNDSDIEEFQRQAWLGSLVDFTVLQELRMPVRNLLASKNGQEPTQSLLEILPSSIEYLCLAQTDMVEYTMLENQLRRLLNVRAQQFPVLQKIVLQLYQMEVFPGHNELHWEEQNWGIPKRAKEVFAEVARICEKEGIEFSFADDGDHQILLKGELVADTNEF